MPVQMYESLLQGISTRMEIFALFNMPINQRSVSTLAVESFFSDLTNMEFSGLGCPKAVDIPRLITHVTQLNTIHHNKARGFVFSTTDHGVYPIDTLEPPEDRNSTWFDLPSTKLNLCWPYRKQSPGVSSPYKSFTVKMKVKCCCIREQEFQTHSMQWIHHNTCSSTVHQQAN